MRVHHPPPPWMPKLWTRDLADHLNTDGRLFPAACEGMREALRQVRHLAARLQERSHGCRVLPTAYLGLYRLDHGTSQITLRWTWDEPCLGPPRSATLFIHFDKIFWEVPVDDTWTYAHYALDDPAVDLTRLRADEPQGYRVGEYLWAHQWPEAVHAGA